MDILIREAKEEDAQLIADLTRSAWAGKVVASSSGHQESPQRVVSDLRDGGGFILLADERPVGSVRWHPLEGESDVWEIMRMGVLPEYRGVQLSQHLLEAVIHQAQACEIEELRLAVRPDQTPLLDLYAAYGFEPAPELVYTYANPAEPEPMVMRKQLRY
ncbi:Ribosomal protein S18 acetylase RimI [Noviherbaspirillum humi]|uniref:Ribosomal protein S18 acetylase RimI n=1 Tax=Noviherbaspirillum humi TaxID=1688639 RepID=A0A239GRR5_9BURK|nr:GNAT family N-acetyltransferase [Noviherbaspirillum humi]SNS71522.1 Ribosomal protein S18 acetylase RimI [Noviherbaspirillum humi]